MVRSIVLTEADPYPYSALVVGLIANKWVIRILHRIPPGSEKRYSDFYRELPQISHKMLSRTLAMLETDEIIERSSRSTPVHASYSLTPFGASLYEEVRRLCAWAKQHETTLMEIYDHGKRRSPRGN